MEQVAGQLFLTAFICFRLTGGMDNMIIIKEWLNEFWQYQLLPSDTSLQQGWFLLSCGVCPSVHVREHAMTSFILVVRSITRKQNRIYLYILINLKPKSLIIKY